MGVGVGVVAPSLDISFLEQSSMRKGSHSKMLLQNVFVQVTNNGDAVESGCCFPPVCDSIAFVVHPLRDHPSACHSAHSRSHTRKISHLIRSSTLLSARNSSDGATKD